ncbi:hypothetical protein [Sulfurimonas gotlandica]|nr:hypothetical protein [Sulfurimonas gotlandica]
MIEDNISIALLQSVIDSQKDLIVIFKDDEPILTNKSFNKFFAISSCESYLREYGAFVDNFVPHPLYFYKEKISAGEKWFDSILKLPEIDRVVSMMTPSFEPHAFSVELKQITSEYTIATLNDITQSLIKRIMIENNANMDVKSGAYAKDYFLHIARSYQDAAQFNEKIIGAILITLEDDSQELTLCNSVNHFKNSTRQDDMLIRWQDNSFLLIYLVDSEENAQKMMYKLKNKNYSLELYIQKKDESIKALIKRIGK